MERERRVNNIKQRNSEGLQRLWKSSDLKSDKERISSLKKVIKKAASFYKYTRINFLFVGEKHWILGDKTCPLLVLKA